MYMKNELLCHLVLPSVRFVISVILSEQLWIDSIFEAFFVQLYWYEY
jgi:hypothetical protein